MSVLRLVLWRLLLVALAAVVAVVLWTLVLAAFHVSTLIGQRPWQTWTYLIGGDGAHAHRREVDGYLAVTVRDFGVGYLIGLAVAFALAILFSLSLTAENVFMPTAMVLRSIPVIVITPLITLLFGVGVGGVSAIVTLVVFLPAMANVLLGLRTSQAQHGDLVRAYGGSRLDLLRKVALPGSLPAIMASARLSIPSAVTGAMIGEWLATGQGLGGFISRSSASFGYDAMYASAVVITVVTMLAYTLVSVLDSLTQQRFGELP